MNLFWSNKIDNYFDQHKMTQYNTCNIKMSKSELNKLKSEIKNGAEVTLNISSNVICDFNDETNFS